MPNIYINIFVTFALLFTNVIYSHDKMCFIYIGLFRSRAPSILSWPENKLLDPLSNNITLH